MGLGAKCGNTKKRFSIARSASACSTATARSHSGSKPHRRVAHLFQAPTHRPTHDLGRTVTSPRLPTPCSLASSQRLVLSAFWQYSLRHRVPVSDMQFLIFQPMPVFIFQHAAQRGRHLAECQRTGFVEPDFHLRSYPLRASLFLRRLCCSPRGRPASSICRSGPAAAGNWPVVSALRRSRESRVLNGVVHSQVPPFSKGGAPESPTYQTQARSRHGASPQISKRTSTWTHSCRLLPLPLPLRRAGWREGPPGAGYVSLGTIAGVTPLRTPARGTW